MQVALRRYAGFIRSYAACIRAYEGCARSYCSLHAGTHAACMPSVNLALGGVDKGGVGRKQAMHDVTYIELLSCESGYF